MLIEAPTYPSRFAHLLFSLHGGDLAYLEHTIISQPTLSWAYNSFLSGQIAKSFHEKEISLCVLYVLCVLHICSV